MPRLLLTMCRIVCLMTFFVCWLCLFWSTPLSTVTAHPVASYLIVKAVPSVQATATQASPAAASGGLDLTLWVAIIGVMGVILGVLLTGFFALYQMKQTAKIEQQRQTEQRQYEVTLERLRKEQEHADKAKEQAEQTEAEKVESLRRASLLARTTEERVKLYARSLHADPRISCMQILSMSRPLDVLNVYIRVRLHEDVRPGYKLDLSLIDAERDRDPNTLLMLGQRKLESRSTQALEPEEAIRCFKHCVIIGDPGAGKTTLLKYLALRSLDKQLLDLPDLPIHIGLNDFVHAPQRDLLDFAAASWDERYGFPQADARSYMEAMLKQGKALLLLDALDETVSGGNASEAEASYKRVAEAIIQLKTRYSEAPIVVTARKAGYYARTTLVGFTELEVLDFRTEDIKQFIEKWFSFYQHATRQGSADDLIARLERNPRIQALAANPLLLSLIVLVYQAQLDLPDRRADLYKRCVDILLTEWDTTRGILRRREFKPDYKLQLLEELAWHFHRQGQRYFSEDEVHAVIAKFLPTVNLPVEDSASILKEISNENGLLKEQAQGWHGFLHLTLQEYFAARYATDHQELDTLLAHRGDPWWEEVILLYAGQTPDASPLLQRLLGMEQAERFPEDIFHTNLMLAGYCLAAKPRIKQTSLREEITSRLFALLQLPFNRITMLATRALVSIGGNVINERLVKMLANDQIDISVRMMILEVLSELGEKSIARELVTLLVDQHIGKFLRGNIARALGGLGEKSVVGDLLTLLLDQYLDEYIRSNIASALGRLGEKSIAGELVALLADEHIDKEVRVDIARALGRLGEKRIAGELVTLLADEHIDKDVRVDIANALGLLGEKSVAGELVALLVDEHVDKDVRVDIARALGLLGEKSIARELLTLLLDQHIDKGVRGNIVSALGRLGEKSIAGELVALLADQHINKNVRVDIARVLGLLGEKSIAGELAALLVDEHVDKVVRVNIASALGRLGEKSVVRDLLNLLSDQQDDEYVRYTIIKVLGVLGDKSVVGGLLKLLADEQYDVRESIASVIGQLANDEASVKILAELMFIQPGSESARRSIYDALYSVSRRARVRVIVIDEPDGSKRVELVKWDALTLM